MAGLREVLARLAGVGINAEVWVDGSFLTEKIDPDDVDFAIRLIGTEFDTAPQDVVDAVVWAVSDLKTSHRVDGYAWAEWPDDHSEHDFGKERRSYWEKWYGTSRGGNPKGIVVIRLGA
nr:hypothetical protein [uncultured Paludibaculum sp.]